MVGVEDCSVLLLLVTTLQFLDTGNGQNLRVKSGNTYLNPANIVVGGTSDLAVEVQCSATDGNSSLTWMYQNGTEIVDGLQAFGISQGEKGGAGRILRVYPARLLEDDSNFICCDVNDTSTLNVSFTLVNGIFFTLPVPLERNESQNIVDLCSVPDIPNAIVTAVEDGDVSYCHVETERGNFRSIDIANVSSVSTVTASPVVISIFNASELVLVEDQFLNMTFRCDPQEVGADLFQNDSRINETNEFGSVTREAAGIYQCLSRSNQTSAAFLYIIVAYLDTPSITPSIVAIILGVNSSTLSLSCSVTGTPLPRITWTSDLSQPLEGVQEVTEFMRPALSTLTLNTNVLPIGDHVINCLALNNINLNASVNISVGVVFQNINMVDNVDGNVLLSDSQAGEVVLTCSVESSLIPNIEWTRNNRSVMGTPPILNNSNMTYSSIFNLTESDLVTPVEEFQCFVTLDISGGSLEANRSISVDIIFANISISPMDTIVMIRQNGNSTLVNLTCGLEASLFPVVTWSRDDGVTVMGTPAERITTNNGKFVVQSELVVDAAELMGKVNFTCTASPEDPRFNQSIVAMATITSNIYPSFVVQPSNRTLAVAGENVTFFCKADGFPMPSIVWEDGNRNIIESSETFRISTSSVNACSSLSFVASDSDNKTRNGSTFLCVAMNEFSNRTTSELGQLMIAGPPESPGQLNVAEITAENATVSWSESFSLINITNYNLTVNQIDSNSSMEFIQPEQLLESDVFQFQFNNTFFPHSIYMVSVHAINRAGASPPARMTFRTSEAVPGPPVNLTSSATLSTITATWTQTPLAEQNGILTNYTVQYQKSSNIMQTLVGVDIITLTIRSLEPGTLYIIRVAAHTGAGMGPFSSSLSQNTTSIPPAIQAAFIVDANRQVNSSTIPIFLPDIGNAAAFNHYWVVALKASDSFDASVNPLALYPNNNSFVFYSNMPAVGQPYIVAEISAANYTSARRFLLGSREANKYNDIMAYDNGPLEQSTLYTVFVWGFSPIPQNGVTRVERQVIGAFRQYDAFNSSAFLSPVTTMGTGLPAGVIAAIVIVVLMTVFLVIAVVIMVAVLCEKWRYFMAVGPPPSRKGSVRLRDQDMIHRPINISNSFRRTSLRSSIRRTIAIHHKAEAELQNLNPDDARLPWTAEEFPKHVKTMHKNTDHLFSDEYEIITIKSPSLPHAQCSTPENINKNRYANINCYDNSRVALKGNADIIGSDYINANFIDGYNSKSAYVAAQGPLANTTHDFWRMVWEQDSCCIIMLTNLVEKSRVKCHQYWPEVGSMSMGDLTISLIEVQPLAYYTIRTFRICKGTEIKEVKQFHYTGWPDFGVPEYPSPVISFINRVDHYKRTTDGPDIIHCSAGVGRTGTLITIQCMMHMLHEEDKVDIFNFVMGMRQQRNYMVQTERQYIFIHDTILEYMRAGDTEVCIQDLHRQYRHLMDRDPATDCSRMEKEYRNLAELENVDMTQFHPAHLSVNTSKNRHQHILPYDRYRVRLLLHPGVHGSDYINACYMDGYHCRHQYIVTQGPMSNTITDFWRMVWEHRCSCIIMLCPLEEDGIEQCVCYWPTEKIRQYGEMFIEQTSITKCSAYTRREMAITNSKINESRTIKHYHYEDWLEAKSPASAVDIIDVIGVLQKAQNKGGGGPIIVHDNTGIGRGGTFVVLSSILEQLKVEGIIDPFLTVHSLRQQQPGLVTNFEQYRFCYQAVMEFLESFDHYANFD